MEDFFIDPASLPGGRAWALACSDAVRQSMLPTIRAESDELPLSYEALHCDVSPFSGFVQVLLLLIVYGGVLFKASELIAYGSELLLLVPSFRSIVGSVVLPILGAVPDGAIVLFSGLGPNAQEELSVGVGALAGSTVMLLTLPWYLSVVAGRVNIRADGVLTYHHRHKLIPTHDSGLDTTGVEPLGMVARSGKIMIGTAFSYLVIQGAAIYSGTFFRIDETEASVSAAAKVEHWPALFCFFVSCVLFFWYLYEQLTNTSEEERDYRETVVDEVKQKAIRTGEISLTAAFREIWDVAKEANESTSLNLEEHKMQRLRSLLRTFFNGYDRDHNHAIDRLELSNLMRDLGEVISPEELSDMYNAVDANGDGMVELEEFVSYMPKFIISRAHARDNPNASASIENGADPSTSNTELNDDEEEEEDVPEDLRHTDPDRQIRNVMTRAFLMMATGTALVLIFSDSMVAVLSEMGSRVGIPAFYISFLLAPLASNASELLAAYTYAAKKTRKTITISFSTLLGAAIMNNTFVLSIFMLLLTTKNLAWTFTAETIAILVVEIFLAVISQKRVITMRHAYGVLVMFPISLFLVAFLENVIGLD